MTNAEQEDGGRTSILGRRAGRKRRVVIGVTGLAAALGVGAFIVTDQLTKDSVPTAEPARPPAFGAPAEPTSAAVTGRADLAGAPAKPAPRLGPVLPASTAQNAAQNAAPGTAQERADVARSANKRLGTEVSHPMPRTAVNVDPTKVHVEQTGSDRVGKMLRVSSARQDLTGYRELAWVRDGEPTGDADCSKKITTSPDRPARARPTLLICWRTSARKSVYTIAVDFKKAPSESVSVAALDEAWRAMR